MFCKLFFNNNCNIHFHGKVSHWICENFFMQQCAILFQAYVSCALGIRSIGYVMICFGVVNALCSLLFGSAMKYIGRFPILVMGAALHLGLIVWLLIWTPNPESPTVFFVISGLWGVGDAVWQTQVNGKF